MSERKPYAERLAELKERQRRLQMQEKALLARQLREEKKEQTKRIFKIGNVIEETVGHPLTDEELAQIVTAIRDLPCLKEDERNHDNPIESEIENPVYEIGYNRFS